jgi:hypothetical protein
MNSVTYFIDELTGIEHAVIDKGNNCYTSMTKNNYDEMIAAQSTPSIPEGGN